MTEQDHKHVPAKKILLATDLSARCDRAMDRASSLAAAWKAELVIVHALERTGDSYVAELEQRLPSWRRSPDPARIVEAQIRRDMVQAAPKVTAIAERGEPAEVILEVAAAHGCDLIVVGLARDETLGRFGLGSTVDRLLRRSQVPLLVVKQRARAPYGSIVVATDFSEASLGALQTARAFFPDRKMTVLHAYDLPLASRSGNLELYKESYHDVAARDCKAFLASAGIPEGRARDFDLVVEYGHPARLIHEYVCDHGVDLVILGTHGRSALLDVFLGSTAKEIMSYLQCDALVVRGPRAAAEKRGAEAVEG